MQRLISPLLILSLLTSSVPSASAASSVASRSARQGAFASQFLDSQALAAVSRVFPRSRPLNAHKTHELASETKGRGRGYRAFVQRWYFTGMAVTFIAVSMAGFLPGILSESRRAPLSILAAIHGIVTFSWLVLYFAQSLLIATKRHAWHRTLGMMSIALLVIIIPTGYATTIEMIHRGFDLSGDLGIDPHPRPGKMTAIMFSVFNFNTINFFGVTVAAALYFRHRPEIHKRLMLFANLALVSAPIAHFASHYSQLPGWIPNAFSVGLLLSIFVRDYMVARRLDRLSVVLAIVLFFAPPIQKFVVAPSQMWHRIVQFIAQNDANSPSFGPHRSLRTRASAA